MTTHPIRHIRIARESDRTFLSELAERLTIGAAPWIEPQAMLDTMRGYLLHDLDSLGPDATVLVAESADHLPVGAVSVAIGKHFTSARQAYIGELAVTEESEGWGVGSALLSAAETWARDRGVHLVALETGVANTRARVFYTRHGYAEESVKLVKAI